MSVSVQYEHFCIISLYPLKSVLKVIDGVCQCEHTIRLCDFHTCVGLDNEASMLPLLGPMGTGS